MMKGYFGYIRLNKTDNIFTCFFFTFYSVATRKF